MGDSELELNLSLASEESHCVPHICSTLLEPHMVLLQCIYMCMRGRAVVPHC